MTYIPKWVLFSGFFLVVILLIGIVTVSMATRLTSSPLHKISLERLRVSSLVAVEDRSQTPHRFIIFRLSDGKQQIVTGKFSYVFTTPDELIVYGVPAGERNSVMFVINPLKARVVDISGLNGEIVRVDPSPNHRFIALKTRSSAGPTSVCVMSKNAVTVQGCIDMGSLSSRFDGFVSTSLETAFWNPDKQSVYVIPLKYGKNAKNILFYPSSGLSESTSTLFALPMPAPKPSYAVNGAFYWYRLLRADGKVFWVTLPKRLDIRPLSNGLVIGTDARNAYVIDPETRRFSFLGELPPYGQRLIATP